MSLLDIAPKASLELRERSSPGRSGEQGAMNLL
jgi:hypothetical protein